MSDDIHKLISESVEKIAGQWVEQLNILRANTVVLEKRVLSCLAKTKMDIAQLHELGTRVAEEASRGREICARLGDGIEKITGEPLMNEAAEVNPDLDSPWLIPGINERLAELHALSGKQMLSMRQITAQLNHEYGTSLTRNAIIGRSRRNGLPPRYPGEREINMKPRKPRRIAAVDAPIAPVEPPLRGDNGLTIYQLRDGDCKWPLEPVEAYPPYTYCGKQAEIGRSWCFEHTCKAHVRARAEWS